MDSPALPTMAEYPPDWREKHFLLVEDNPDHQFLIRRALSGTGVGLETVATGEEAVECTAASLAAGEPYDLVLLDIRLPKTDGYAAAGQMRRLGYRGPIVALTAAVLSEEVEKCRLAGCDACIHKPFESRELREAIRVHLDRHAARHHGRSSGEPPRSGSDENAEGPAKRRFAGPSECCRNRRGGSVDQIGSPVNDVRAFM